jgi:hypothetical protein
MIVDKTKFSNKKDLLQHVVDNKAELIAFKKNATKITDPFTYLSTNTKVSSNKIITNNSSDNLEKGVISRTVVGNAYGWFDSHEDVHIPNIFSKSISENKNLMFHLHDHLYQVAAKVGTPKNIYEQSVSLIDLGLNKIGSTPCLLMDTEIKRSYNEMIYEEYLNNQINQHSVGMIYVKLFLCVNDPDYKEEFSNWNTYKGYVINLDKAEENGYFWAITEAKLREISCVLQGSNELTPTINTKDIEADTITSSNKNEPPKGTQTINHEYLINQFKKQ